MKGTRVQMTLWPESGNTSYAETLNKIYIPSKANFASLSLLPRLIEKCLYFRWHHLIHIPSYTDVCDQCQYFQCCALFTRKQICGALFSWCKEEEIKNCNENNVRGIGNGNNFTLACRVIASCVGEDKERCGSK